RDEHDWRSICPDCGELRWLRTGDVVESKVASIYQFGVFVELAEGVRGLIHVSELDSPLRKLPKNTVGVGDLLTAEVLRIDYESKIISLSTRRLDHGDL